MCMCVCVCVCLASIHETPQLSVNSSSSVHIFISFGIDSSEGLTSVT